MNSNLLDKEVLCAYDIRAIQKYIFQVNNNRDIIGSSYILRNILYGAISHAMAQTLNSSEYSIYFFDIEGLDIDYVPYFDDRNVKAKVIYIGGGNAFVLYRTGKLCQTITRLIQRYFLEHTYSLQLASAVTLKTDVMSEDLRNLTA